MCCTERQGTVGWSQWLSFQSGRRVHPKNNGRPSFSLDDVIARTKPIYRYKETGHPSLQAPKIHALRDEFINLGFVRPSTSLRKGISWHDFFQVASFNAVEASKWQDYMWKGLQCHAVFVLMPINRINSNWSQPRGYVYWNTRHNRTVYQYANFLSHWVHSHFTL